jgi:DNA-binding NarL/FixJ family response regulator
VRKAKDPSELRTAVEAAAANERYTSGAHAAAMESATAAGATTLSTQEREVLRLYATGLTISEVASKMHIKISTAKGYLDRVRDKYEERGRRARSKIELRSRAIEDGLLPAADSAD